MAEITWTTKRTVTREEIESLVHGTGVTSMEWWRDFERVDLPLGHGWKVIAYRKGYDDGTLSRYTITDQEIANAFGQALSEGYLSDSSDVRDAQMEDLGYLDAMAADVVLQIAVYGEVVYG